jgi:predicted lipoprotein with Yx(FWY)xxD motif
MSTTFKQRSLRAGIAVSVAGALAVAGCGGSSGGSSPHYGGAPSPAKAAKAGTASVGLANSNLGKILVNAEGRTLYLFEADHGSKSTCTGACAQIWPPLKSSGTPMGIDGVPASKLGTTKGSGGASVVTYNGHPLYTYAGDTGAGQATGEGSDDFGAEWYVVSAAGNKVEGTS